MISIKRKRGRWSRNCVSSAIKLKLGIYAKSKHKNTKNNYQKMKSGVSAKTKIYRDILKEKSQ